MTLVTATQKPILSELIFGARNRSKSNVWGMERVVGGDELHLKLIWAPKQHRWWRTIGFSFLGHFLAAESHREHPEVQKCPIFKWNGRKTRLFGAVHGKEAIYDQFTCHHATWTDYISLLYHGLRQTTLLFNQITWKWDHSASQGTLRVILLPKSVPQSQNALSVTTFVVLGPYGL